MSAYLEEQMGDLYAADDPLGFDDDGEPKPMALANAVQVWSILQKRPTTVAEAALAFNVTPSRIRAAVSEHPWMLLVGHGAGAVIEHDGV